MNDFFVYGTLRHKPLLDLVAGAPVEAIPARISGFAVYWAAGESFPMITAEEGGQAEGLLLSNLTGIQRDRLDYYELAFGYQRADVCVDPGTGHEMASCYIAARQLYSQGEPFDLDGWIGKWAPTSMRAAEEVMMSFGNEDPRDVGARFGTIRMRASSYANAQADPSALTPSGLTAQNVISHRRMIPYANYFAVDEHDLSFQRHDGSPSEVVNRATFMAADAVIVLPYDPVRDRVLLVEQFRAGPYFRGDPHCWALEPVAGRIDPGETAIEAAERETREEARLEMSRLIPVNRGYPSPGCSSEYYHLFVGLADLPDDIVGVGGEETEAEDIRTHLFSYTELMEMVDNDRISTQPTCLLALWLSRARDGLRQTG